MGYVTGARASEVKEVNIRTGEERGGGGNVGGGGCCCQHSSLSLMASPVMTGGPDDT